MINNTTYIDPSIKAYLNMLPSILDDINIIPHILDLEKVFVDIVDPIIINQIPLKSNFTKDIIEYIANTSDREQIISCKCGKYSGKYFEGITCEECNTKVTSSLIQNLKNDVWFSTDIPLPNPLIYLIISGCLKEKNSSTKSYLDYILDVKADYPKDFQNVFVGKGFKYFYDNFDFIIDYFVYTYPKTKKRKNIQLLKILLNKYKDRLFTTKLPIMSKFIQPITKSGYSLKYADESLSAIVKSIISITLSKYTDVMNKNISIQYEKNLYRMYSNYINYIIQIIKTKYSKKKSYFRKNVFSTKLHFSFRNVIVPICNTHMGDEVYLPWGTGLTIFTYHIINIFTKRMGMSIVDAYNRILAAYYKYDPVIDQIFQLLILESKFKGLPLLINRNPTLLPSGTFIGFITKIKPETTIISEQFIKNFGKLDKDKTITTEFIYNKKEIYSSRKLILKGSNGYDTLETIINNQENKMKITKEDINKIINGDSIKNNSNNLFDNTDIASNQNISSIDTKIGCDNIDNSFNQNRSSTNMKIGYNNTDIASDQNRSSKSFYDIEDKAMGISYIPAKLINMDYDGDKLDVTLILETRLAEEIMNRIHPSSFFIGNGSMEIKGGINIPRQHALILNRWLNDIEDNK